MRELKVIGLDVDGKRIICEGRDPADKYTVRVDDRLRAAVRGDRAARVGQMAMDLDTKVTTTGVLRPRDIQSRIRAGASVAQVAESSGMDISKIERFAHPVLLERSRAAELATAAHPVLADGPAVATLLESVTTSLSSRGLSVEATNWDAWRNEDGRWTVQLGWRAGLSDNLAHFRFSPGSHGGTVTPVDDCARELVDPNFGPVLRPVAPLAQLEFDDELESEAPAPVLARKPAPEPEPAPVFADPAPEPQVIETPEPAKRSKRNAKPAVPAWEDVLLGVRSSGDR